MHFRIHLNAPRYTLLLTERESESDWPKEKYEADEAVCKAYLYRLQSLTGDSALVIACIHAPFLSITFRRAITCYKSTFNG